jgi:hypothetical protein
MQSLARGLWPAAFAILTNAPARWAMAQREHQFGRDLTTTFVMALLADMACLGPVFALALAPSDWLATKRGPAGARTRRAMVTAIGTAVVVGAFMWLVSIGATEFRIQRGTYPALSEIWEGLNDATFIRGSARIALFERYSWPTLVALFGFAAGLAAFGRIRFDSRHLARAPASSAALGSVAWACLAAAILLLLHRVTPPNTSALVPPLVRLVADVGVGRAGGKGGVQAVLASTDFEDSTVRSGLHWLGFGDRHARCLLAGDSSRSCAPHPLARPLPGDSDQPASAQLGGEASTPLVKELVALSSALFEGPERPLTIWHVALESFRADDLHALHASAPAEIAPFVNAAYAPLGKGGPRTIAFRHAYQSGLRTAQAVSGLWCGLGALPFQLALSRDLVDLPLRCTPDVLRDAGFELRLYYGSNATFEHLGEFARTHKFATTDLSTLPQGLPRGAFGAVTDAALLRVALLESPKVGPLAYQFVLTLSGHSPFDLPEDVSPMTQTRAGNAIAANLRMPVAPEDRRRLVTMSYADDALAAFVRAIEASPVANRSIFLVSADHATADPFLWGDAASKAMAQVPLFFYLPAAFIASSKDPQRIAEILGSLDAFAANVAVSINDVPTLLLALLAKHPALDHLSREHRWHTLGGASSSHHFASSAPTTAQVWGIDASSRVFVVHSDAVDQLLDTGEHSIAFSVWNDPLGPLLKDVSGALSAILRACGGQCTVARHATGCCDLSP